VEGEKIASGMAKEPGSVIHRQDSCSSYPQVSFTITFFNIYSFRLLRNMVHLSRQPLIRSCHKDQEWNFPDLIWRNNTHDMDAQGVKIDIVLYETGTHHKRR